jgi:hypothetical protein
MQGTTRKKNGGVICITKYDNTKNKVKKSMNVQSINKGEGKNLPYKRTIINKGRRMREIKSTLENYSNNYWRHKPLLQSACRILRQNRIFVSPPIIFFHIY